jgi:hypothetical protein
MESLPKKRAITVSQKQSAAGKVIKKVAKKKSIATPVSKKRAVNVKTKAVVKVSRPTLVPKKRARVSPRKVVVEKGVVAVPKPAAEDVSFIPGTVSIRLKEKAALYALWYAEHSPRIMARTASTFGFLFVVLGLLTAFVVTTPVPFIKADLFASVECSLRDTCQQLFNQEVSSLPASELTVKTPLVLFASLPPLVNDTDTELMITVQNASLHGLYLRSLETGEKLTVAATQSADDSFTYKLPTSTLRPGDYKVYVRAQFVDSQAVSEFVGPVFRVEEVGLIDSSATSTDNEMSVVSELREISVEENLMAEVIETRLYASTTESLGTTTTKQVVSDQPNSEADEVVGSEPIAPSAIEPLSVTIRPGVASGQYVVTMVPTYRYTEIELYARPQMSTQAYFLGSATKADDIWRFWLDTEDLPVGDFTLVAEAWADGEQKAVTEVPFAIPIVSLDFTLTDQYQSGKSAVLSHLTSFGTTTSGQTRNFGDLPEFASILQTSGLSTSTIQLLTNVSADIRPLLRSYAAGVQADDVLVTGLSERTLDTRMDEIIADLGLEASDDRSVYELVNEFTQATTILKQYISTTESRKREETNQLSSLDTDNDGLSDYDEYLWYETDPHIPDTDQDGVIDGVEVATGFDPRIVTPQVITRFHTPEVVEETADPVLDVAGVYPLLVYETDVATPHVQAEIAGVGLPNSFVMLYVFSDPLVTTVRTAPDGSFSFTLAKELPDGDHAVYAALMSNTGEVVARSEAFRFTKTGTTFSYIPAPVLVAAPVVMPVSALTKQETAVAAVGIVALGLILLLLAQAVLRPRDPRLIAHA